MPRELNPVEKNVRRGAVGWRGVGMSKGKPSVAVVKRAEIVGCCHKQ